jgi:hypothetical protein
VAYCRGPALALPLGKESPALARCHARPPCRLIGCLHPCRHVAASPADPSWFHLRAHCGPEGLRACQTYTKQDREQRKRTYLQRAAERNLNPQQTLESILVSVVDRMQDNSTTLPGLLALYKDPTSPPPLNRFSPVVTRAHACTDAPPLLPSLRGTERQRRNLGLRRHRN